MCDELEKKFNQFIKYIFHLEEKTPDSNSKNISQQHYNCPCCNYPTLPERGVYYICPLCFWEDDGQDEPFCEEVWGGPNGNYSLTEARNNFVEYLTYYRPSDDMFEDNAKKEHIKITLIQKYEQLKVEKNQNNILKLKNDIDKLKSEL